MPSVNSSSVVTVWASSTVMTPSWPTLVNASPISLPISRSCAEIVATCAISCSPLTGVAALSRATLIASTAESMPRFKAAGLAPAATLRRPALTSAWASTVAVVVPSPATSFVLVATDLASCAPRFSYGSSSSISRAIVTPSFVITGGPNDLSMTTLRPLGPIVTLTVSASLSTPRSSARRASSSKLRILGIDEPSIQTMTPRSAPGWARRPGRRVALLFDDREDVARGQHEVLLAGVLDLGAAVLAVEHDVADRNVERDAVAIVVEAAGADGDDGALLWLLLRGIRNDDARGSRRLGLVRLDHEAVLERFDADLGGGHGESPLLGSICPMAMPCCRRGGQPVTSWHSNAVSANSQRRGAFLTRTCACSTSSRRPGSSRPCGRPTRSRAPRSSTRSRTRTPRPGWSPRWRRGDARSGHRRRCGTCRRTRRAVPTPRPRRARRSGRCRALAVPLAGTPRRRPSMWP